MKNSQKEEIFAEKWYAHGPMRNALIAGLLTGIAFALAHLGIIPRFIEISFYVIAIPVGGYHWAREGIEEFAEERKIGIEILMLGATVGSAFLGLWDEAAFLVFLYGAAEGIEEYTYAKTRGSIRKLLDLAPKEAALVRDGREVTIPARDLKIGNLFIVRPGESIPTDGIIVKGRSSINEAALTGESIPVEKKEGMKVFAGTMNQEGAVEIRATATFEDNTLSKIIHLVEEAQEQKGKAQLFIEKFGMRYSPVVLLSALLVAVIPPLFWGGNLSQWATRAVVLLVAAAPCALIMSTPVAIAAGIGKAGGSGVLIKGGVHLENLGKIKAIAFDKTGTLTRGKPVVTDIVALIGDELRALQSSYSIERLSEHPLAQAIVEKANEFDLEALEVTHFEALTGSGVKASIGGREIFVGKPELFEGLDLNVQDSPHIERLRNEGKTVILLGTAERIEGIIAIRDEIRPQAREVVQELHNMGIQVIMLTGDNKITARAIAKALGIDVVRTDLKPEDKIEAVNEFEQAYGVVAMVGDGINDAPALARATVGIAMGTAGTDAAIEASDVALMADALPKISYAIHLGKRAQRISGQNIVLSLAVLGVLIPSALIGIMSVASAVFVHEASELLAVANGLRVARGWNSLTRSPQRDG
ncbi:MAG: heavy metal translocating P-type ATPase [Candidatus Methylomirabilales bacterium]